MFGCQRGRHRAGNNLLPIDAGRGTQSGQQYGPEFSGGGGTVGLGDKIHRAHLESTKCLCGADPGQTADHDDGRGHLPHDNL